MQYHFNSDMRRFIPIVLMVLIFLSIYTSSILLTEKFKNAGIKAFEKPNDPANIFYFFAILLLITVAIILLAKLWRKELIQIFVLFAVGATIFTLIQTLLYDVMSGIILNLLSATLSGIIVISLLFYPEWYVIDLSAILLSISAVTIFGISLSIPLVIALLIILALYDAISVYKTKHMIDLADTVVDLKLPVLFVIPHKISYRFRKQAGGLKKQVKRKERDAFFVGVGDVVIPGILVISSYSFTSSAILSLSVIAGIVLSFIVLMIFVSKGKPHAGLPFLNTGAILGYIVSSLIFYKSLIGFTI